MGAWPVKVKDNPPSRLHFMGSRNQTQGDQAVGTLTR